MEDIFMTTETYGMWDQYKWQLSTKFPALLEQLAPGADEEAIQRAEAEMGISFPESLKNVYRKNNGEKDSFICGVLLGFSLYSLDQMVQAWKDWQAVKKSLSEEDLKDIEEFATSVPEGHIKKNYINAKWIPICDDAGGNHIGVDLDPDTEGKVGQIITFGRDEDEKIVVAEDLDAFFLRMCGIVASNHFAIEDYEGNKVIILNDHAHLIDYLKDEEAV